MKNKRLVVISVVSLLIIFCITMIMTKPNEGLFANWMEENYNVQCLDFNCDTFHLQITDSEKVTLQSVHGGYSPGIFVMEKDMVYRNLEDSSYFLNLKVKGFFGKISIVEETKKLSNQ